MVDSKSSDRYTRYIDYAPTFEGPMYYLVRRLRGEPPPFIPDEAVIRAMIEEAYVHGFLLRDRYDDPMRRRTRLVFRRRNLYPHDHMPPGIER